MPYYIFNRVVTSTVQAASSPVVTLMTNSYDVNTPSDVPGIKEHDPSCAGIGNPWGSLAVVPAVY